MRVFWLILQFLGLFCVVAGSFLLGALVKGPLGGIAAALIVGGALLAVVAEMRS